MNSAPITPSSSAEVVPFPASDKRDKRTFAKISKDWLRGALAEPSIKGHAPRTFFTAIYLHFNYEHYERTGELIAWPSWETLMAKFGLSDGSIREGIAEGERCGFLEVQRGRRNGHRRDVNVYHALLVNPQSLRVEKGSQPATAAGAGNTVDSVITKSNSERGNYVNGEYSQPVTSEDSATRLDSVTRTPDGAAARPEEGKAEAAKKRVDVASPQLRALMRPAVKRWRAVATNGSGDL
jgi:hypothetical protein